MGGDVIDERIVDLDIYKKIGIAISKLHFTSMKIDTTLLNINDYYLYAKNRSDKLFCQIHQQESQYSIIIFIRSYLNMKEKSFILFKPNHFGSNDIYRYILNQLKDNELIIEKEYSLQLTPWQMCNLWPRQCNDRLLYYAMAELYAGFVKIIEVCGNDSIKKVNNIKKKTRTMYAIGILRNCIHAPISTYEYFEHIKVIYDHYSTKKLIFNDLPYVCCKNLNEDMCKELAKYILNIGLYTIIHSTMPYEDSTKRFRYYLAEDNVHSFTDYVCFICDCFQRFNFQMASVSATILKLYGEVCLLDTDEERSADVLAQNGTIYNMTIYRHELVQV